MAAVKFVGAATDRATAVFVVPTFGRLNVVLVATRSCTL